MAICGERSLWSNEPSLLLLVLRWQERPHGLASLDHVVHGLGNHALHAPGERDGDGLPFLITENIYIDAIVDRVCIGLRKN